MEKYQEDTLLISNSSLYTNCIVQNIFKSHGQKKYMLLDICGSYHEVFEYEIDNNFEVSD